MNNNIQEQADNKVRIRELEHRLSTVEAQLEDIRRVISSGNDILFLANRKRADAITALAVRVNELEEYVFSSVFKIFPRLGPSIAELNQFFKRR